MESCLFAYYDPFTGSLIIQIITVGIFSIGASFRYWQRMIFGFANGVPRDNDDTNE